MSINCSSNDSPSLWLAATVTGLSIGLTSFTFAERLNPFVDSQSTYRATSPARLLPPQAASSRLPNSPQWHKLAHAAKQASSQVPLGPGLDSFEPIPLDHVTKPARLPLPPSAQPANRVAVASGWPRARQPSMAVSRQRPTRRDSEPVVPPSPPSASVYLASQTAKSQVDAATRSLDQAMLDYRCSAFASAESSAWSALQKAAEAIDLAESRSRINDFTGSKINAMQRLRAGRLAMQEARDFIGPYSQGGGEAIARLARSHQTAVVRQTLPNRKAAFNRSDVQLAASEVIDRYLDYARAELSVIAGKSLLAAKAMDLLAAITLGRGDASRLPGPTAICLRRAAVQGQSHHPDLVARLGHHLADIGLVDEARWALQHSLKLAYNPVNASRLASLNAGVSGRPSTAVQSQPNSSTPSQGRQLDLGSSVLASTLPMPEVTAIQPRQFAAISPRPLPSSQTNGPASGKSPFSVASYQRGPSPVATTTQPAAPEIEPKRASRFLPMFKKWW